MAYDFPLNPTDGQTANGYTWNGYAWVLGPVAGGEGGTGVTDGDMGDIVVSDSGATWLFDSAVVTPAAKTVLDDDDIIAMRTTLGAASLGHTHLWADITDKPATFTPTAHSHPTAEVTGLDAALTGKQAADPDLTSLAGAAGTNTIYYRSAADTWSPVTIGGNLTFLGGTLNGQAVGQPADATLTALAALNTVVGLVEQTGIDTFTKRGITVSTSGPSGGADGDLWFRVA